MKIRALMLWLLFATAGICQAQDSIPAQIHVEEIGDSVHFSANLRPLRQIAGAPTSFYTYFWELGDGRFSFEKDPVYSYRDTGVYQVRLYATNNYDDGKAPPTRPHPVKIKKKSPQAGYWASHFFHGNGDIEMKINRNPRPGEDFVAVIGYRNQSADTLAGTLVLFFNERQFGQEGFALAERRSYNGEDSTSLQSLMAGLDQHSSWAVSGRRGDGSVSNRGGGPGWRSAAKDAGENAAGLGDGGEVTDGEDFPDEAQSLLKTLDNTYARHTVLHFPAVRSGEERFVFMDMNTLPGMLQDTNAIVSMSAMMVPDDPSRSPEVYQMDMQVVSSHDPNHFMLKSRRINYRFMGKKKELTYRIQFQNTGKGPARKVAIGFAVPPQLNTASIGLKAMSPVCRWCDPAYNSQSCIDTVRRSDSIYFVFKNIYLPGLQQEGILDKDSTIGFVEYTIRFKKKPKKIPFSTQAAIVFDRNEPVYTNKATARFIKGISPGIMVGYSALPSNGGYSARGPLQFGYVLAPYAPFRPFFQVEAFVGLLQQDEFNSSVIADQKDTAILGLKYLVTGRQSKTTTQRNSFEITPLHFRYNLNNWVGIGGGAMVQVNISEQTTVDSKVYYITQQLPLNVMTAVSSERSAVKYLGNWNAAPFVDIQLGRVRTGPVLGIRYIRLLKGDLTDRFFLYAGFKL